MSDIHTLATRVAETQQTLDALGHANQPNDAAERVKADARYMLAHTAHQRALLDYDNAMSRLTTEELIELTK